jgi:hypothetical protein
VVCVGVCLCVCVCVFLGGGHSTCGTRTAKSNGKTRCSTPPPPKIPHPDPHAARTPVCWGPLSALR